jgi:hypothetical protein
VRVEDADVVGVTRGEVIQSLVTFVAVTADAVGAIGAVVLGKGARPQRVVREAGRGLVGPVVGWPRVVLVQEAREAGNDLFTRPAQGQDAQLRLHGDGVLDVGQVEGGGVATDGRVAAQQACQACRHHGVAAAALPG